MGSNDNESQVLRDAAATVLSQARADLTDIRRAMGQAAGNDGARTRLADASAQISGVTSEISVALGSSSFPYGPSELLAFQNTVTSADLSSAIDDSTTSNGKVRSTASIAAASAATRQEVEDLSRDIFDKHIFDAYLRFSSADDEAAFRARTAATQKYINVELDRHTAEGDLNAGGGMMGSMLDAHAHGAGNSPEFKPRWEKLTDDIGRQRDAMIADGQTTTEFDRNLGDSVHRYLKAKGLSDDEIAGRLKAERNPVAAAKSLLKDDRDTRELEFQARLGAHIEEAAAAQPTAHVALASSVPTAGAPPLVDLEAVSARLRAVGVQFRGGAEDKPAHGVTVHGTPPTVARGSHD